MNTMRTTNDLRTLGIAIRSLRKQRNMTGTQLAEQTGLSQAKVSRIENGILPVQRNDIDTILNILRAPLSIQQQAAAAFERTTAPAHKLQYKFAFSSFETERLEARSKQVRVLALTNVPVLLQTAETRLAILHTYDLDSQSIAKRMHATVIRQEALWDGKRSYEILIHESALYTRLIDTTQHIIQLDRVEYYIGLNTVSIGIIPYRSGFASVLTSSFAIHDNHTLYRESGNMEIKSEDNKLIGIYQAIFDELGSSAAFGQQAIDLIRASKEYFRSD